jgi:lactoylglutathione lyase
MLRVKDGPASVAFYRDRLGMTLIRAMDLPQYKFSLFFLVSATQAELRAAFDAQTPEQKKESAPLDGTWATFDPTKPNEMTKTLWNHCLELTYNHGTESDPNFKVHDGNGTPQGFGHTGFLVDDIESACTAMEAAGVRMKKRPSDGNMRGIAFAYDPDGYWVELIDRTADFAGVAANL